MTSLSNVHDMNGCIRCSLPGSTFTWNSLQLITTDFATKSKDDVLKLNHRSMLYSDALLIDNVTL